MIVGFAKLIQALVTGARTPVIGQTTAGEVERSTSVQTLTVWGVEPPLGIVMVIVARGFGLVSKMARLHGSLMTTVKLETVVWASTEDVSVIA